MSPAPVFSKVLAASKAGRGSKKLHDWSALLNRQTRTRLSLLAMTSANTVAVVSVDATAGALEATATNVAVAVKLELASLVNTTV